MTRGRPGEYRYARRALAEDYLRLGWMIADDLDGTHHGGWSMLMFWPCDCRPVVPVGA